MDLLRVVLTERKLAVVEFTGQVALLPMLGGDYDIALIFANKRARQPVRGCIEELPQSPATMIVVQLTAAK